MRRRYRYSSGKSSASIEHAQELLVRGSAAHSAQLQERFAYKNLLVRGSAAHSAQRQQSGLTEEKQLSGPEFGPGGYLPPKAAKRARKIVLREQMGFGWPLAAVGASLLVLIAGGAFLYLSTRPPSEPFLPVGPVSEVPAGGLGYGATVEPPAAQALLVRAGGPLRAFWADTAIDAVWCAESGRIETAQAAWTPDGRLVHGEGESLQPLRSVVHDGVVYVDFFSEPPPRPSPAPSGQPPVCVRG